MKSGTTVCDADNPRAPLSLPFARRAICFRALFANQTNAARHDKKGCETRCESSAISMAAICAMHANVNYQPSATDASGKPELDWSETAAKNGASSFPLAIQIVHSEQGTRRLETGAEAGEGMAEGEGRRAK